MTIGGMIAISFIIIIAGIIIFYDIFFRMPHHGNEMIKRQLVYMRTHRAGLHETVLIKQMDLFK